MATANERTPILVIKADKAKFVRKAKTHRLHRYIDNFFAPVPELKM